MPKFEIRMPNGERLDVEYLNPPTTLLYLRASLPATPKFSAVSAIARKGGAKGGWNPWLIKCGGTVFASFAFLSEAGGGDCG